MSLGKRLAVICGIATLALALPCSIRSATIRDDQPDSSYLALANDPDFAAVGLFVNSWGYTGSATLIAPDWILTAAHNLVAATSGTFTLGGIAYGSTQLIQHSGWTGDGFNGYDFGLVHLSSPVTNVAPAELFTESLQPVMPATFVGFGFTGTGLTGATTLDNLKRGFNNTIDGDFGNPARVLGTDFDNPHTNSDNSFGSPIPLPLEGCVANGDSGGGVFISTNSHTYLVGVISFVAATDGSANSDYGDVSGFGRVSAVAPWINSYVPEPSTPALLAALGCLALFRRRIR